MDLHVYRQPCAYVYVFVNFFFKKLLLVDWIFTKFHRNVP